MDSSSDNILTLSFERFQRLFSKSFCSVIFRLDLSGDVVSASFNFALRGRDM